MSKELSRDEVAALIRARKILKARVFPKDVDVKTFGISRGRQRGRTAVDIR